MSEPTIFSQVTSAFEPFVRKPEELYQIRLKIAKYIESLQTKRDAASLEPIKSSVPACVKGTRQQFLKTQHAHVTAESEYRQLRDGFSPPQITVSETPQSSSILQTHLEVLRLRKQYQKYQIISRYVVEAEALAEQNNLYDGPSLVEAPPPEPSNPTPSRQLLLHSRLQDLTRHLEIAVLQANHDWKREIQLLEDVKSRSPAHRHTNPETKLHALSATRTELTKWIEECLMKCDIVNEPTTADRVSPSNQRHDIAYLNKMIDEYYENYLQARARLLNATTNLIAPHSPTALSRVSKDQQITQDSTPSDTTPCSQSFTSIVPYLDSQHLMIMNRHRAVLQSQLQSGRILVDRAQDLAEQLMRLSDESHLLPSFPILAKSKQSEELHVTDRLLEAWQFAVDAAGTATAATIEKQVDVGKRSVEQVNAILDEQAEFADTWKKLETR